MVLSEACILIADCPHTSAKDEGQGIALIRTPNVGKGRLILDNVHRVSEAIYQERIARAVPKTGDLILAREAPVGNVAIIQEGQKVCLGQRVVLIRANTDIVLPDYLVYYLLSTPVQHKLINQTNETTVAHLNVANIRNLEVSFPNIRVQHRIASILSSLDRKIELNNKINAQLEEMAQAIFKSWFVDFEPFKDGKFVESELGMIPEGWRVGKFTEIMTLNPGGTPKTSVEEYWENGNIPFFSPKDVSGTYCFDTEKHITTKGLENCSSKLYQKDTVFITCRGTVGKVTMAATPMAMNQSNYAIIAKDGYCQTFSFFLTKSIVDKLLKKANGAVFSAITTKDFDEKIVVPPYEEVLKFDRIVDQILKKIIINGLENLHLAQLRDTLLPKLMNGEIELPDDDYLQHCLYYKGEEECPFPAGTHAAWYWRDEAMGQDENHRRIGHSFIEKGLQFIPLPAEQVQQLPSDIQEMLAYATACACNMQPMGGDEYLKHYGKSIEELNEIDKK